MELLGNWSSGLFAPPQHLGESGTLDFLNLASFAHPESPQQLEDAWPQVNGEDKKFVTLENETKMLN